MMTPRPLACLAVVTMALLGFTPASASVHLDSRAAHAQSPLGARATLTNPMFATGPPDVTPVCSGNCTVLASSAGYVLPVVVLHSGSNVTWHSIDIGHVQRETSQPLGSTAPCFVAPVAGGGDSAPVQFDIAAGALTATVAGTTATCLNAVPAAGQAFLLPYHCTIHANMRGALLVTP